MSGKPNKYAGTRTEKNLEAAFAGESQARNKYTYFAQIAEKEGMDQIAEMFLKSAENEKVHAKIWFRELGGIKRHGGKPFRRRGRRELRVDRYV